MPIRNSTAEWHGDLKEGKGTMKLASGLYEGPYTFASRFEEGKGTNPEELIGAAQAGCFSMFLSALLAGDGFPPKKVHTEAKVHLGAGPKITLIELIVDAEVPGIEEAAFQGYAEKARDNCPVSVALGAVPKEMHARLVK